MSGKEVPESYLLERMLWIRLVEETIAHKYAEKKMRCPVHLSIGQEGVAVGVCANLQKRDVVYSNHRCHAHYLAKGGNLDAMIAELHGKKTGCCQGLGGSMHLVDLSVGFKGASALVGGSIGLACGAALSFKLRDSDQVSVCFFGDGACEEGALYEALNFAALHKLPVLFVCENNLYATYTPLSQRQAVVDLCSKAQAFGVAAAKVDGNEVVEVFQRAQIAISALRDKKGPFLLECSTYRFRDHVGPNYDWELGYRSREEVEERMKKCPIIRLKKRLEQQGKIDHAWWQERTKLMRQAIEESFQRAEQAPFLSSRKNWDSYVFA